MNQKTFEIIFFKNGFAISTANYDQDADPQTETPIDLRDKRGVALSDARLTLTQAEADPDGGYWVLDETTSRPKIRHFDEDGREDASPIRLQSSKQLADWEDVFSADLNGDSRVGPGYSGIEDSDSETEGAQANGTHQIHSKAAGGFAISTANYDQDADPQTETPIDLRDKRGVALSDARLTLTQAEADPDGGYWVLDETTSRPKIRHFDEDGREDASPIRLQSSKQLADWEDVFSADLNGDSRVGPGYSGIEDSDSETEGAQANGTHQIHSKAAGGFAISTANYDQDADPQTETPIDLRDKRGVALSDARLTLTQAEADPDGGYWVLDETTSRPKIRHFDEDGREDASPIRLQSSKQLADWEDVFSADLNGDSRVGPGYSGIEDSDSETEGAQANGTHQIHSKAAGGFAISTANYDQDADPQTETPIDLRDKRGVALSDARLTLTQAEADPDGGYWVLDETTSRPKIRHFDEDGREDASPIRLQSSKQLADWEDVFSADLNGDGNPSLSRWIAAEVMISGAESDGVTPKSGTLIAGHKILVTVTVDENITVTGTPAYTIDVGGDEKQAAYVGGSGTKELVFAYEVQAGDADAAGGIEALPNALVQAGGTLTDSNGNGLDLTTTAVTAGTNTIVVDGDGDNSAPTFSSATVSTSVAENQTSAYSAAATDADGDTLTYSIAGGADQGKFDIDGTTGALTFKSAPDYESPDDADTNGEYEVIVEVEDTEGNSAIQMITITVTDDEGNSAPTFSSATASNSVAENQTSAYSAAATDADGDTLTYSIAGGADQGKFDIDGTTGALTFKSAPDYESPDDANTDRVYEVEIQAADTEGNSTTQTVTITVTDDEGNSAPTFSSATASNSVAENQTSAYSAAATDADGDTLTYSIAGGADQGKFDIDGTTGALTFKSAPDYESPDDANTDRVYEVEIQAADTEGNSTTQTVTITVTDDEGNSAPTFSSATASNSVAENQTSAYSAAATDADGDTLTYSIAGGADQGKFDIDGTTGALTFKSAPDYESPDDANTDRVYEVEIQAADTEGNSTTQTVTITVTDEANSAPVPIEPIASTSVVENQTAAYTPTPATDADGDTLTYSIAGGADQDKFDIDVTTGALTFKSAPDYEALDDSDTNGDYVVIIQVEDTEGNSAIQMVTITVTNDTAGPTITSTAPTSVTENTAGAIYTFAATDTDAVTYSMTGADAAQFSLTASGALSFATTPDYETPLDAGSDNTYDITLIATDAEGNTATQTVSIAVTQDTAGPTITSTAPTSVTENTAGAIYTFAATDTDAVTYSMTGTDAAQFSLTASGALSFATTPDYETPLDAGSDNTYDITLIATDAEGNTATQTVSIAVTQDTAGPTITSTAPTSVTENTAGAIYTFAATDTDAVTYSMTGTDAAQFSLTASGALSFATTPDYETPLDAGSDNTYDITLIATDAEGNTATQTVSIAVTQDTAGPTITSTAPTSVTENTAGAIYTFAATDTDAVTYSMTGTDAAQFSLTASGALSFATTPDYETPLDAGSDNTYDITLIATDAEGNTATQTVSIAVTQDTAGPTITSTAPTSVTENTAGAIYTFAATDTDAVTYSMTGTDAAQFSLTASGALSFATTPDYETPLDAGSDNTYDITLIATDAEGNTATQTVSIAVTQDTAGPTITSTAPTSVTENTAGAIYTFAATDTDAVTYSMTGTDAAQFSLTASGALSFATTPDYETPLDAGSDNTYDITLIATDAEGNTATQTVSIAVTQDTAGPTITSTAPTSVTENTAGAIYTFAATDTDAVTYSMTGTDAAQFSLTASGALSFATTPDYETPLDAGSDNTYDITLIATDAEGNTATQTVSIAVTQDTAGPTITSTAPTSVTENTAGAIYTFAATDTDAVTYSMTGTDAAQFSLTASGALSFATTPDYETPLDAGSDNTYDITLIATDAEGNTATQTVSIAVTDEANSAPVPIEPIASTSVVENQTAAYTPTPATDADGDTLTYSIAGGADQDKFDIDVTTGALTFKSAPDYEALDDSDTNGDYVVIIQVEDTEGNSAIQMVTITVTNDTAGPTITSTAPTSVTENAAGAIYTFAATDTDAVTYSMTGADAAQFSLTASGALSFATTPDYETPLDAGSDNTYDITLIATDAEGNTATQTVSIAVTQDTAGPTITSTAPTSVTENTAGAIYTFAATDTDAVTYSMTGTDAAQFSLTASGALSFATTPDYETPLDAGSDNTYDITLIATDAEGNTATQTVSIAVTQDTAGPTITSTAPTSVTENTAGAIYTFAATDTDAVTYSMTGTDAAQFSLTASGALSFATTPDYETPLDAGSDNTYDITLIATDAEGNTATQTVSIAVTQDTAGPTITSTAPTSVTENTAGAIYTFAATDTDAVTYSMTGTDAAQFSLTASGALSFATTPDYETPLDAGSDNTYDITLIATDAEGNTATQTVSIAVTQDTAGPTITSTAPTSVTENTAGAIYTFAATDTDAVTYSMTGTDAAQFSLTASGALSFATTPDYETPLDAGSDNTYDITLIATDAEGNTATQTVSIAVTDEANSTPQFSSGFAATNVDENQTAAFTVTAIDADGDTLTYSIHAGADADKFDIDGTTGALTFKSAPDYEIPDDDNADRTYEVFIQVEDTEYNTSLQFLSITVDNVFE